MKLTKFLALCSVMIGMTGAVSAEDGFYLGAGVSYTTSKGSSEAIFFTSEDDFVSGAVIAGYRKQVDKNFWAAELQLELPDSEFNASGFFGGGNCAPAFGPYVCEVDTIVRLRGVYGVEIADNLELYGTLGLVYISGDAANSPVTQGDFASMGFSMGVGLQRTIAQSWKVRGEVNHDVANKNISEANGALNGPFCCAQNIRQTSVQLSLIKAF